MLRDSFRSMKADLLEEGKQFIDVSSHTLRTATLEKYSEKTHLTVNVHTLIDWFRSSVFPTARYCSPCGDSFGVQQSANGCPRCGNPKRNLGYNSNTAHLPFVESNQEGLKMVGGHRLLMKSFILRKPAFNALMDASKGLITPSDALKVLLTYPVAIRKQMKRKLANGKTTTSTVKLKGRLVPAWYECVHATHKEDQFGLVVETMHKGEL